MNQLYKKILDIKFLPKSIKISIIIGINWFFQSLLYMNMSEKILKIFVDLTFFIIIFFLLKNTLNILEAFILSFFLAHSINWLFNGHIFALLKTFDIIETQPEKFNKYFDDISKRSSKENSICAVAIFGSFSREELKKTSDLDIRVVKKPGMINSLKSSFFVMIERTKAFLNKFPLDIYLLNDYEDLSELGEPPVIIFSNKDNGC